jgi:hypothetical protein
MVHGTSRLPTKPLRLTPEPAVFFLFPSTEHWDAEHNNPMPAKIAQLCRITTDRRSSVESVPDGEAEAPVYFERFERRIEWFHARHLRKALQWYFRMFRLPGNRRLFRLSKLQIESLATQCDPREIIDSWVMATDGRQIS